MTKPFSAHFLCLTRTSGSSTTVCMIWSISQVNTSQLMNGNLCQGQATNRRGRGHMPASRLKSFSQTRQTNISQERSDCVAGIALQQQPQGRPLLEVPLVIGSFRRLFNNVLHHLCHLLLPPQAARVGVDRTAGSHFSAQPVVACRARVRPRMAVGDTGAIGGARLCLGRACDVRRLKPPAWLHGSRRPQERSMHETTS